MNLSVGEFFDQEFDKWITERINAGESEETLV